MNDKSFGIIPVLLTSSPLYLLIKQKNGYWGFPKGHKITGETDKETALRELLEETGISEINILDGIILNQQFKFLKGSNEIEKKVSLYIGITSKEEVKIQKEEIDNFKWCNFDEAMDKLTYIENKQNLKEADNFLHNNGYYGI